VRPKWRASFANNSAWHKDLVKYVREQATNLWPAATKDLLAETSDARLLACLKTTFKSWASTYKAKWKGVEDPEAAEAEGGNNDDKKKRDDQQNRRRARPLALQLVWWWDGMAEPLHQGFRHRLPKQRIRR